MAIQINVFSLTVKARGSISAQRAVHPCPTTATLVTEHNAMHICGLCDTYNFMMSVVYNCTWFDPCVFKLLSKYFLTIAVISRLAEIEKKNL